MNNKTSVLVKKQFPDWVKADYPKFMQFLEAYYRFMETYTIRIEDARDVDRTSDDLLAFLRQEFVSKFPNARINDRRLIKIIRSLYAAKGTATAIELLFKFFFAEAVTIIQPGKEILRASDGRWVYETSITVRQFYKAPGFDFDPDKPVVLTIENDNGIFLLEAVHFQVLSADTIRFHYNNINNVSFQFDPEVETINVYSDTDEVLYRGKMVKTPSYIKILEGGENWRKGQLIVLPGTFKNTIARVTDTDAAGRIIGVEIYEYGFDHATNEVYILSPFPNKPTAGDYDLAIAYGDGGYDYTLTIDEQTDGIGEEVVGVSTAIGNNSYWLPGPIGTTYSDEPYVGTQVLYKKSSVYAQADDTIFVPGDLTFSRWYNSLATIEYVHDYQIVYRGQYVGDNGQISNPNIKLQDNYFYQMFSYVIQTQQDVKDYRNVLSLIHPAGLKFFGDLNKIFTKELSTQTVFRSLSKSSIYFSDEADPNDLLALGIFKAISDLDATVTQSDGITSFVFSKFSTDTAGGVDIITSFDIEKVLVELISNNEFIAAASDVLAVATTKNIWGVDTATSEDTFGSFDTTKTLAHTQTTSDGSIFSLNTSIDETFTVENADGTPAEPVPTIYNLGDSLTHTDGYDELGLDAYAQNETLLTIG